MGPIFFSYATEDGARVAEAARGLRELGLEVLLDHEQIGGGASIPDGIDRMIRESSGAALFFSSAYARKPWTLEERNALVYRSLSHDYPLVVVRLDREELPPLLAHRLWTAELKGSALARFFAPLNGSAPAPAGEATAIDDWLVILQEHEREALGAVIFETLREQPTSLATNWRTKRLGAVRIRLAQPVVGRFRDDLEFVLRMLGKVGMLIRKLRERIDTGGLGIFQGPFELELNDKLALEEGYRRELGSILDAVVDRVERAYDAQA